NTDELWWDPNTQKFYTSKPVHIHKKDGTIIDGQNGMEAPQNFSSYVIYKGSGRGVVPKEEDSTATQPPPPAPAKAGQPAKPDTARGLLKVPLKKPGT